MELPISSAPPNMAIYRVDLVIGFVSSSGSGSTIGSVILFGIPGLPPPLLGGLPIPPVWVEVFPSPLFVLGMVPSN